MVSEAPQDTIKDAIRSLQGNRTALLLTELYGLDPDESCEEVKNHKDALEYDPLCDVNT